VTLFGRIAWTGAAFFAVAFALALLVWKPSAQSTFVAGTDVLLRNAERDFEAIATSLVDETMSFTAAASLAADEQRALALKDLPLDLYVDAEGRLQPERLREALRAAIAAPHTTAAEKHAAVRAEILDHTRQNVKRRLQRLHDTRSQAAEQHADRAAWRTIAAWGGMLLVLLAGWAVVLDRVVLRPLREATVAVGRFGAGERGVRVDPAGASELAALARAFNETTAAVERAEAENAELRSGLEDKVKERTKALQRAARAATAGTMAGGIAHEFNNLLGGILGCTEAALAEQPSPEVREALEMVRKTATRGVGVTRALLRATRAEPELASCDPAALFDEAVTEVRPGAGVAVVKEFEPVRLRADAAMLRQVLANLVRNAVEAVGDEGRVVLGVVRDGDEVLLRVEDDGPGIEPSVRDVLFEPFVTTRRGGREGAGLGLFLAERLVGAHHGRIECDAVPGGGTRFVVHLPSAQHS